MEYSRSISDIIKERTSRRSYTPRAVEAEKREALERMFAAVQGPFGGRARFAILDTSGWGEGKINALGTYGTIQGATLFLVGMIERGEHDMEDFGHQFEQVVLRATDLGLGTCWIGGIFNRSRFALKAGVRANEVLPAISPLGYATERRSVADSVIRWSAGSRSRRPWVDLFFDGGFDRALEADAAGRYVEPIEMLRLGPSASNRQPWRVVKEQGRGVFHLFLCRSRGYDKLIKAVDLQRLDMGIAMSHFELAASELGLEGRWRTVPPRLDFVPERTEYVQSWIGGGLPLPERSARATLPLRLQCAFGGQEPGVGERSGQSGVVLRGGRRLECQRRSRTHACEAPTRPGPRCCLPRRPLRDDPQRFARDRESPMGPMSRARASEWQAARP